MTKAFGTDEPIHAPAAPSDEDKRVFMQVAKAIRDMKPRDLQPSSFDDVYCMIEYMQDRLSEEHERITSTSKRLEAQIADLKKRERELEIRVKGRTLLERMTGR